MVNVVWQIVNAWNASEIGESPFFIHERRPDCIRLADRDHYSPDPLELNKKFGGPAQAKIEMSEWGIDVVLSAPDTIETIGTLVIGSLENEIFALEQRDNKLPRYGLHRVWGDYTYFALVSTP